MSSNIQDNNKIIIDSLLLENQNLKQQVELLRNIMSKNNKQQQLLQQENNFLKMQLDAYESVYAKR
jgi:hypothetical protein